MTTKNELLPKVSAEQVEKIRSVRVHVPHPKPGGEPRQIVLPDGAQENIAAPDGAAVSTGDHDEVGTALEIELGHEHLRPEGTAEPVAVEKLLRVGAPERSLVVADANAHGSRNRKNTRRLDANTRMNNKASNSKPMQN